MKKLLGFLTVLMVAAAIAVAGCGKEAPAETVDKAIQNSQNVKSQHIDFDVRLEVKGDAAALGPELAGLLPLDLTVKGGADVDNSNTDSPKVKGSISFEGLNELLGQLAQTGGAAADSDTQLGLGLISGFLSDMEFVVVDKNAYIKMAGTWYDIGDASSLSDLGGMQLGDTGEDSKCYQDAMKDPGKFGSDKIFKNLQEINEEKIDGTDTRHFKADVDLDKSFTALADIARGCGDEEAAGGLESGRKELASFFRKLEVEMWVDKDNNFRQMKVTVETDPAAISDLTASLGAADAGADTSGLEAINMYLTLKFSRFGEEFNITKPEGNIMKLEDLLGSDILGGLGGTSGLGGLEGLDDLGGTGTTGTGTTGTSTSGGTGTTGTSTSGYSR